MTRIDEPPHKPSVRKVEDEKEVASRIPVSKRQFIVTPFRFDSSLLLDEVVGQIPAEAKYYQHVAEPFSSKKVLEQDGLSTSKVPKGQVQGRRQTE